MLSSKGLGWPRYQNIYIAVLAFTLLLFFFNFSGILDSPIHSGGSHRRPSHHEPAPPPSYLSHDPMNYLPEELATQYCANYRMDVWPKREQRRKIYDLMLINTELDWLDIRLGQMSPHVDYFVIIESDITFQDTHKPLHVAENWSRFSKYHSKMIRHTLNTTSVQFKNTWAREEFSRNAMYDQVLPHLTGEMAPQLGDVILVSDVDELPKPAALTALRNCRFPKRLTLQSEMYYYSFQWRQRSVWGHPEATFYDGMDTVRPNDLRMTGKDKETMYHASWHCSYCFATIAEFVTKVKSFSHKELNNEKNTDPKEIVAKVRGGVDLYERKEEHYDRVENNRDVPDWLERNRGEWGYIFDRDGADAGFRDWEDYNPPMPPQ